MLEVRLNLAFLRMTMKHTGTLVKGAALPPTLPIARPVTTMNTCCLPHTSAHLWSNWDGTPRHSACVFLSSRRRRRPLRRLVAKRVAAPESAGYRRQSCWSSLF
jgi:hypothetical protein